MSNLKEIKIGNSKVGNKNKVLIVAELSANHNQNKSKALELVKIAKNVGADAIKLQTYTPDTITLNSNLKDFKINKNSPWSDFGNLYNLFKHTYTPWEWHEDIFELADKLNLEYFSSPFDETSVDFLSNLGVKAFKIASPEITDVNLISKCISKKIPLIVSLGCAEFNDIELLINLCKENKFDDLILLKCSASYPAPLDTLNLLTIKDLIQRFNCLVGLSCHSLEEMVPVVAVTLGAKMLEKHLVLEGDTTPDSFFSLTPNKFEKLVNLIRDTEKIIGGVNYDLPKAVKEDLRGRRSLYFQKAIFKGEKITKDHIKSVRPAWGLHPKYFNKIIGRKVLKNFDFGDRVDLNHIDVLT